jgi:hypothetical protein
MRVDSAGKDVKPGCVDLLTARLEISADRVDAAVHDLDVHAVRAASRDEGPAADYQRSAVSSRKRPTTSVEIETSEAVTDSAGLWLTPPLQRTNSMPTSVSEDIATAS